LTAGTGPAKVAFSPAGKTVATVAGRKVTLWDAPTGIERRTLAWHRQAARALAFAPDGRTLATGAVAETGGEVNLWDIETGKPTRTLNVEGSDINVLGFAPDGQTLVGGGLKGLWCWNAATGDLNHRLPTEAAVLAVAFSPDGTTLASGGFDTQLQLWDTKTWQVRRTLSGHRSEVRAVAFAPDGETVASGGVGEVLVWDVDTGQRVRALKAESTVWALAFVPSGKALASGSGDPLESAEGGVQVWDVTSGGMRQAWTGRGGAVMSVAISPDGKMLASGRYDGTVTLRDLSDPPR
jgi:WD40 repeat protein